MASAKRVAIFGNVICYGDASFPLENMPNFNENFSKILLNIVKFLPLSNEFSTKPFFSGSH